MLFYVSMNSNILILSFIIATIFTVSVTETIQTSDGVLQSSKRLLYNVGLGEIQSQIWTLTNNEDSPIMLEFYATGPGSEFLTFDDTAYLEPATGIDLEVFVEIPADHQDNIEYHPNLYALKKGITAQGATGITINVQMKTIPFIKIGDNPIYTPPADKKPDPKPEDDIKPIVVEPVKETMEERLAKIKAANEANKKDIPVETEPDPTLEQTCGAGTILVDGFCKVIGNNEPIVKQCNWFEIFLSWFGIGKC